MLQIVANTFRLLASKWPALVAFFLAGWIANYLLIRFGGYVANIDALYGQLVLPLAVLARVASYVAMFLVLRPVKSFAEALGSSILPFFVVFATWGMIHDDWVAFSLAQLQQRKFDGTDPALFIGVTPVTIGVVVAAFVLRLLIKRFAAKLPKWFNFFTAYLEAVWIFIAVDIIAQIVAVVPAWLATRQVVVWGSGIVEQARQAFAPLRFVTDAVVWLIQQAATLIGLPLAWLTLAGIVYAVVTVPKSKPAAGFLRKRLTELGTDFAGRWVPIANSARLIWRAGVITMALFVLAYAILDTSSAWLHFGIDRLVGPHELGWWFASDAPLSLVVQLIVEPARICLIAAAWMFCLSSSKLGKSELVSEELQVEDEKVGQGVGDTKL